MLSCPGGFTRRSDICKHTALQDAASCHHHVAGGIRDQQYCEHDRNVAVAKLLTAATLCAGAIMFCDGSCMRAFHCGVELAAPDDSDVEADEQLPIHSTTKLRKLDCNPLDMPLDLYKHLKDTKDTFHCPNCLAGVHQCFKCKQEGVVEAHAADAHNACFAKQLVFRCIITSGCLLLLMIQLLFATCTDRRQCCMQVCELALTVYCDRFWQEHQQQPCPSNKYQWEEYNLHSL